MRYSASLLAKLLILATFLVVSGCSDAPKEPVDISYSNGGVEQPISSAKPGSRGFFNKKLKNLFSHKNTVWE